MTPTRDDLALYVMGSYDGDVAALEAALAGDEVLRAQLAEEAELEGLLRDAAASATFCPACDDLVRAERCTACGAAVRPGGYVVERVLVANAHGRMYVARDADGKQVALKELAFVQSPGSEAVAAFEREAKFLRALEHPAIPRFCAAFEEGDGVHTRYYLAQELVTGTPLDARLEEHFYTETEIVDLARQVLGILVYLQSLSPMVIHRDIKPANLLRRDDGSIALVDFGAAHVQGTTAGSTSIGTFGYMPIEQLAGQVDATTDPYALGASLLHLLTRQEPWRIISAELTATLNVSAPLRRFLEKLVAPRREDRFANAASALDALERRDEARPTRAPRVWRPMLYVATAVVALAGAGVAGFALHGQGGSPQAPQIDLSAPMSSSCLRYAAQVDRVRRCVGLTAETRMRLLVPYAELLDKADLLAPGDAAARDVECQEASDAVKREAGPVCPELDPGFPVPVPSVRPTPPKTQLPVSPVVVIGPHAFTSAKKLSVDFKGAALADVLRFFGAACDANIVLPDSISANVTVNLADVPCDQAIEVLLEAHGLWYRYVPAGKLLQILPRRQLDMEMEEETARERAGYSTETGLPAGPTVDIDMKNAPLRDMIQMLATQAKVNVVIPEQINGKVTLLLTKVSWDIALRSVLQSHGLWFRYRDNGRVLRIAPRRELDADDEAARARAK
jgi:serine/threonine protein kinase